MLYELPPTDRAGQRRLARYYQRRAVTARARRREHGAQEPTAAKLQYMKGLRKIIRGAWDEAVRSTGLRQDATPGTACAYLPWFSPGYVAASMPETLRHDAQDPVRLQVLERVQRDAPALIGDIGKKVSGHNARQMRRLVGVDPRVDPGTGPVIDAFREENLRLITNLTEDMLNRVGAIVKDYLGGRVEDLAAELEDGLGWATARANLVARDQTLKLNGQLTRVRMQNAGISEYVWTTSGDERVRESHATKDGRTFRWDTPPDTGHPGEDYQCRCTAYPVIPGLDEGDD